MTVKVTGDVVVTALPVRRGQVLGPEDVRLERADLTQLPSDVLTDPQRAVGKSANVAFPAGFTLREDMLRAPFAVTAGQRVRILFQGDGLQRQLGGQSAEQRWHRRADPGARRLRASCCPVSFRRRAWCWCAELCTAADA